VASKGAPTCKRSYELGKRSEATDRKRSAVLRAARVELEARGFSNFTMDTLAKASGVTRQTVHNLFGTKTGVVEALFDQLAQAGGMERMGYVMQQTQGESMLCEFVKVFSEFWAKDRVIMRRIHGFAAIDPELGAVVNARNRRRRTAAARVIERLGGKMTGEEKARRSAVLYALTSFEFFDALCDEAIKAENAWQCILQVAQKSLWCLSLDRDGRCVMIETGS
jgi:AcrR family transcriptional regulator